MKKTSKNISSESEKPTGKSGNDWLWGILLLILLHKVPAPFYRGINKMNIVYIIIFLNLAILYILLKMYPFKTVNSRLVTKIAKAFIKVLSLLVFSAGVSPYLDPQNYPTTFYVFLMLVISLAAGIAYFYFLCMSETKGFEKLVKTFLSGVFITIFINQSIFFYHKSVFINECSKMSGGIIFSYIQPPPERLNIPEKCGYDKKYIPDFVLAANIPNQRKIVLCPNKRMFDSLKPKILIVPDAA